MKIVITGSHFTPAQSVIERLSENPEIEIVYMGRKYARDGDNALSVEAKLLPEMGIKFIPIIAGRLNRFISLNTLISFFKTPIGFIQSFYFRRLYRNACRYLRMVLIYPVFSPRTKLKDGAGKFHQRHFCRQSCSIFQKL